MNNKLVLADGTEIEGGRASKSSRNQLMIRVPGDNLIEYAVMFSDPNKTETIVCYYSIYKATFTGYTYMYSIQYFKEENYVELWLMPVEDVETSYKKEVIVPKEYVPEEVTDNE